MNMQQNAKIKPLKQCSCSTCRLYRGTVWAQRDRKAANRRIRRIFRDLLPEDGTLLVMSLDRA